MINWVYAVSDNTNSNSGRGGTGGLFEQAKKYYGFQGFRAPCVLHVIHLAAAKTRPVLMGGPLPQKNRPNADHFWTFLWNVYFLFGKPNVKWEDWKKLANERGFSLRIRGLLSTRVGT